MNNNLMPEERNLMEKIIDRLLGDEKVKLRSDLENAYILYRSSDNSHVEFGICNYMRPSYKGQRMYSVEGKVQDNDGVELEVFLYSDENGHLLELELVRWDNSPVISPEWATLKLY